jgi:hypothetical protein
MGDLPPTDHLLALMKELHDDLAKQGKIVFDYRKIARALEEIPQAIVERIKRNQDGLKASLSAKQLVLPSLVEMVTRVSANTWDTIYFLCGENMDHGRKIEFLASVPPLTRTLADTLFTVVYIFDQPEERSRRFAVSGWGKAMIHWNRMNDTHGADPRWQTWLRGFRASAESTLDFAPATDAEKADLETAARWPNPGKMTKGCADATRKAFLEALQIWVYAELSEDSHVSYPGLVRRSAILHKPMEGMPPLDPQNYRTMVFLSTLTVYTALLSEIACQLALDYEKGRLRDVWTMITANPDWHQAIALHDARGTRPSSGSAALAHRRAFAPRLAPRGPPNLERLAYTKLARPARQAARRLAYLRPYSCGIFMSLSVSPRRTRHPSFGHAGSAHASPPSAI